MSLLPYYLQVVLKETGIIGGCPKLSQIMNDCLKNNAFPDILKKAEISPCFKKGNKGEFCTRKLLSKIDDTGDKKRKKANGRPGTSQSDANFDTIENLILSQESDPGIHLSLREIEMETEIPRASVHRIAKFDLGLTSFKITNVQRLTREDEEKQLERGKGYCAT